MRARKLSDRILLVTAPKRRLAKMFLRFEEHYENPKFRGKVFTLEEFKEWYLGSHRKFTYYSDWAGFDVPGECFKPFIEGRFDPLSPDEEWLVCRVCLNFCTPFLKEDALKDKFVIGASSEKSVVFAHELAHALYHTEPSYRGAVDAFLGVFKGELSKVRRQLVKMGYGENVLDDEAHAYVLFDRAYLKRKRAWNRNLEFLRKLLLVEYKKAKEAL